MFDLTGLSKLRGRGARHGNTIDTATPSTSRRRRRRRRVHQVSAGDFDPCSSGKSGSTEK